MLITRAGTKAEEIAEAIRSRIVDGELRPGGRLPTRVEIESRYSASTITVQRALDHLSMQGFVAARGRGGTFVVEQPPHLYRVGIVFPRRPNEGAPWSRFATALRDTAASSLWAPRTVVPFFGSGGHADSEDFQELLNDAKCRRLAGLIFAYEAHELAETALFDGTAGKVPRVCVSPDKGLTPRVHLDGLSFHRRGLAYLHARGRRRVASLLSSEITPDGAGCAALCADVERLGMETRPEWIHGVDKLRPGWTASLVRLLVSGGAVARPDALLIHDDNIVEHATAGLVAAGVRVPDDIEVVAHCNFPWPTPSAVPLVRLGFDVRQILRVSLEVLDRQRSGKRGKAAEMIATVFEHELDGRESEAGFVAEQPGSPARRR